MLKGWWRTMRATIEAEENGLIRHLDVLLVIGVGEVSYKVHHINGPDRDDCAIVSRVDNIILGISHGKNKEYAPGCSRSLALSPVPRKERDLPARDSQFWQLSPRIWKWNQMLFSGKH